MSVEFVIKALRRGIWFYFRDHEDRNRQWTEDLYQARKFISYAQAEVFLFEKGKSDHWGGYFQIEKNFVQR